MSIPVAAELLGEFQGFYVGFDDPEWDYYHAPRQGTSAPATRKSVVRGGKRIETSGAPRAEKRG